MRRFQATVPEVELVIVCEDERHVWARLSRMPALLSVEPERNRAQLARGVPLLLHFTSAEKLATALIAATGDETHVEALREHAEQRGFRLTRDGLAGPEGSLRATADEAAIYRNLGLSPVPPEQREGRSLQPNGGDYGELVTQADICHVGPHAGFVAWNAGVRVDHGR
jgi:DNA polymerase/3'-5' exonuclease PolX